MNKKFHILLNPKSLRRKASKDTIVKTYTNKAGKLVKVTEVGAESIALTKNPVELTPEVFVEKVLYGHTWTLAYFFKDEDGKVHRTKKCWHSQSLFALDFDDGITPEEVIARCKKYGLDIFFVYASFSDTPELRKFRVVFIMDEPVTDFRDAVTATLALMKLFPECDEQCKDPNRFYYGGKAIIPICDDYAYSSSARVSVEQIVEAFCVSEYENNYAHAKDGIKKFARNCALNLENHIPKLSDVQKLRKSVKSYINNIEFPTFSPKMNIYEYAIDEDTMRTKTITLDDVDITTVRGRKKFNKVNKFNITTEKTEDELIEKFDWDMYFDTCILARRFEDGDLYPFEHEFMMLALNYLAVKGGMKRLRAAIARNKFFSDEEKVHYAAKITYYNNLRWWGVCSKGCPGRNNARKRDENWDVKAECMTCTHDDRCGITAGMKTSEKTCEALKEDVVIAPIHPNEASDKMTQAMYEYLIEEQPEGTKSILMCIEETGAGKSTAVANLQDKYAIDFSNTIMALPTHKCIEDVAPRVARGDYLISKPLILEDAEMMKEYTRLVNTGHNKMARDLIQSITIKYDDMPEVVDRKSRDSQKVKEYIATDTAIKNGKKKFIFCTHKKAMTLDTKATTGKTLIVDEDILMTALFEQVSMDLNNLIDALRVAELNKLEVITTALKQLINAYEIAQNEPLHMQKLKANSIPSKELTTYRANSLDLNFDIMPYLKIKNICSSDNGSVVKGYFINEIPFDKVIVMSATAQPFMYEKLFPNTKVMVHTSGNLTREGVHLHHHIGTSRDALSRVSEQTGKARIDKIVEQMKKEAPGVNKVITFKTHKKKFEERGFEVIATFGNCMGVDAYGGQDIAVVGTPHVDNLTYFLLADAIKPGISIIQDFEYVELNRNGFRFKFNTFKQINTETGRLLHDIQMYLIESELIQAVGRARIVRKEATVHTFCNLPLKGATIYGQKK